MVGEDRVNLCHKPAGFGQGAHHPAIMLQVIVRKGATLAVLEPLLAHLVATDVQFPNGGAEALEVSLRWSRTDCPVRRLTWAQSVEPLIQSLPSSAPKRLSVVMTWTQSFLEMRRR